MVTKHDIACFIYRGITLNEALDILENDDIEAIYMEPPENATAVVTDEDSGDEDGGGTVSNLPGRLLRAPVEALVRRQQNVEPSFGVDSSSDDSEPEPRTKGKRIETKSAGAGEASGDSSGRKLRSRATLAQEKESSGDGSSEEESGEGCFNPEPARKKAKKNRLPQYDWKKENLPSVQTLFPEPDYSALRDISLTDIFELFYDDELCQFLADESNKYATQNNNPNPGITKEEIRVYLGIHMLSTYSDAPNKRAFWEDASDTHRDIVCNAMRRNRFLEIDRFIHCADNTQIDQNDKMFKMRPLIERVNNNCKKQYRPEKKTIVLTKVWFATMALMVANNHKR